MDECLFLDAVKKLDDCLGKVVQSALDASGIVVITADHGNVEEKMDKKGKKKTSHTLNPVPFFILDSQYQGDYVVVTTNIPEPRISNVMVAAINLMGYEAPEFYEKSLLKSILSFFFHFFHIGFNIFKYYSLSTQKLGFLFNCITAMILISFS